MESRLAVTAANWSHTETHPWAALTMAWTLSTIFSRISSIFMKPHSMQTKAFDKSVKSQLIPECNYVSIFHNCGSDKHSRTMTLADFFVDDKFRRYRPRFFSRLLSINALQDSDRQNIDLWHVSFCRLKVKIQMSRVYRTLHSPLCLLQSWIDIGCFISAISIQF